MIFDAFLTLLDKIEVDRRRVLCVIELIPVNVRRFVMVGSESIFLFALCDIFQICVSVLPIEKLAMKTIDTF